VGAAVVYMLFLHRFTQDAKLKQIIMRSEK
jgi:hypothetical protein